MGRGGQQGWGWWVSEAGRSGRASLSTDPRAGGREQLEHLVKMRKNTTACGLEHRDGESGLGKKESRVWLAKAGAVDFFLNVIEPVGFCGRRHLV